MKSIYFSFSIFAFLFGCSATANKVRESPPRIFENSKQSESVVNCVIEKYDGIGLHSVLKIVPKGDGGKTIKVGVSRDSDVIKLLIDISPIRNGSSIKSYENFAVLPADRKIVEECGSGNF